MCRAEGPAVEQFARQNASSVKVVGVGVGDVASGQEFVQATDTGTPTMVVDEQYALWSHYEVYANSEAVLLDGAGVELARFDQFDAGRIAAALP